MVALVLSFASSSVPSNTPRMAGNKYDPFRHIVVAKEFIVSCNKSSKPPDSIQIELNGDEIPANLISSNTESNGNQVQQSFHDNLHVFFNAGDSLTIRVDSSGHRVFFKRNKESREEFQLKESDFAGKEELSVVSVSGKNITISLAIKPGFLEDIMETVSLPDLNPLLNAQEIVTSKDMFSTAAQQLRRVLANISVYKPALQVLESAIDLVGQTHPLANALLLALRIPYLMVKNKLQFTEDVKKLAEAMLATCKSLSDARFSTKILSAKEVFASILVTIRDAALYLELYNRKEKLRKFLAAQFPQKLQEYAEALITKKNEFQTAITIQIARDVDMIASLSVDDYLRKRLNPAEVSVGGEGCMVGTRVKILREAEEWAKDESKPDILWIKGAPGAGKSTIATTLAERLNKPEHPCVVFFCKRDKEDLRDPLRVWRTVAYQFADFSEAAKSALMSALNEVKNKRIKDSRPLDQFQKLVKDILSVVDAEAKLYSSKRLLFVIIIDALDECHPLGDDRSDWDSLLSSLGHRRDPHTKGLWRLVVTSRQLADIQDVLKDKSHQITLNTGTDVSEESNTDIKHFFIAKFAKIRTDFRISSDWPGEDSVAALTTYAGGLFIWAEMGVKYVGQRTVASNPEERLKEILSDIESDAGSGKEQWRMQVLEGGLDRLYARIIYDAFRRSTTNERSDAKKILATAVLAMEPLRMRDIVELFSMDDRITPKSIESTLRELSTIISISDGGVPRVCHKTVSDFFLSYDNSEIAMRRVVKTDSELASYVIKGGEEHALACASFSRQMFSKDVHEVVKHLNDSRMFNYALRHWDAHLKSKGNKQDFSSLSKAMQIGCKCLKRFAHMILSIWAEAIVLVKHLRDSFNLVVQHLEGSEGTSTVESIKDYTAQLDAARGEFQVAAVLYQFKALDADAFLRSRLEPSDQSQLDGECLDGTRRNVLQSVDRWLEDPTQKNILWINGPPGAGKSTLATTLQKRILRERACVKVDAKRDFLDRRNPKCIWRTVAYQLAGLNAGLRGSIMEAVSEAEQIASVKEQFHDIIQRALKEQQHVSLVIIIDALDECFAEDNDDWKEFSQSLSSWTGLPFTWKLMVTSRITSDIVKALEAISVSIRLTAGADASEEAKADTALYLRRSLALNPPPWLTEALMQRAIAYASGSFIWAKMLIGLISNLKGARDLEAILVADSFGGNNDMDFLYGKLLVSTMGQLNEKERSITRSVLSTIALAKDPLSKRDLISLVPDLSEISCEVEATHLLHQTLSDLSAIVASDDAQPIRIPHKSFIDFFLDKRRSSSAMRRVLLAGQDWRSYLLKYKEHSVAMAIACLRTMNSSLKFNVYGIESSYTLTKDIVKMSIPDSLGTGFWYAWRFWIEHLHDGDKKDSGLRIQVHLVLKTLLGTNFLYWLEVVVATNEIESALGSLDAILRFVDDDELKSLTKDAIAFVRAFKKPISQSIPHIYLSALAFCSTDSRIFQIYGAQFPRVLSYITTSSFGWLGTCPRDAAYIDEERIVVASGTTAFVWNCKTKVLVWTLTGHEEDISCVSVSSDGKLVATGSDGTVRIWDSDSGNCLAGPITVGYTRYAGFFSRRITSLLRKDHLDCRVFSIEFSPDGLQFVNASQSDVEVRNVSDGSLCFDPLTGHKRFVLCVAFSPDGRYIASGSEDNTVRVWDAKRAGKGVVVLTAHTEWIYCLAFSPDGLYLATASGDRTIRIWNVAQGFSENGIAKTGETVLSMSFSPNSEHLVAGSSKGRLFFWNISSGSLQEVDQYFGYSSVNSVGFSPDGRFVVTSSESHDGSLKIWTVPWLEACSDSIPSTGTHELAPEPGFRPEGFALGDECFISEDGWMCDLSEEEDNVLFWVPEKIRYGVWLPRNTEVLHRYSTKIDTSRFAHGREWTKCRDPLPLTS